MCSSRYSIFIPTFETNQGIKKHDCCHTWYEMLGITKKWTDLEEMLELYCTTKPT